MLREQDKTEPAKMRENTMKSKFITFEGSEGCGKSTQSKLFYQYLKRKGCPVVYLREPGSTKIGEQIRRILLAPRNQVMAPACEMLLYMAARAQIVSEIISPSLKKGKIVICDRFLDSTLAYQGYGLGINSKTIKYIGDFVTAGIKPDLTIFLNLATEKGLERCGQVKDRIEKRSFGYHLRVKEGYLKLARQEPTRIKIIRVESSADKTQEKIRKLADRFLEKDVL